MTGNTVAPKNASLSSATRRQRRAANPRASVWVSAAAGSGKTKVLVDRLVALLLNGAKPSKILCLTYTKAAAAEMANRLALLLKKWAVASDAELSRDLRNLPDNLQPIDPKRARRLFAEILDSPGGIQIQTIHGFCQSVLRRFPLEAGLPPHFRLLEERDAASWIRQSVEAVLAQDSDALMADFALLALMIGEDAAIGRIGDLIGRRGRLNGLLDSDEAIARHLATLHQTLGLTPGVDQDVLLDRLIDVPEDHRRMLCAIAQAPDSAKNKTDRGHSQKIADFFAHPDRQRDLIDDYKTIFITAEDKPRGKILGKSLQLLFPEGEALCQQEAARVYETLCQIAALELYTANAALLRITAAIWRRYDQFKQQYAYVDYEDLIQAVHRLTVDADQAAWVLYKLDGGIDHLLIDEAQDTSPAQWAILDAIANEFFSGDGARASDRTVFAVGDPKQSIYSFQNAAPEQFDQMKHQWKSRVRSAMRDGLNWEEDVRLFTSFRSAPAVLQAADRVFALPAARKGVDLEGQDIHHEVSRFNIAGRVTLWPLAKQPAPPPEESETDEAPAPASPLPHPRIQVAQTVAATIDTILRHGTVLPATGQPAQPGDFLILVRQRGQFVPELLRALQQKSIPVAGSDRLQLTAHIAVQDLMALGDVMLLPDDDLTLACVLKSPLIGLREEQLFTLAHGRKGSLWRALWNSDDPDCRNAASWLGNWQDKADYIAPYDFFARILIEEQGRHRLVARLGNEANEPIDEFLNLALRYEQDHPPSLQGFLQALRNGKTEIKRDLDNSQTREVRIMTVHGAKGLQAPIVFLADTAQLPISRDKLLWEAAMPGSTAPLWMAPVSMAAIDQCTDFLNRHQEAMLAEYRRLLYVAMTRAQDQLYIGGWLNRKQKQIQPGSWYDLIERGLETGSLTQEEFAPALVDSTRWHRADCRILADEPDASVPASRPTGPDAGTAQPAAPSWLRTPAPRETPPIRPLSPSRLGDDGSIAHRLPITEDQWRLRRGRIIHRLLQILPNHPPGYWNEFCRTLLSREGDLPEHEQRSIHDSVMAVLNDPDMQIFFSANSQAEISIVGEISCRDGRTLPIAGQVDRIAITDDCVWVLDYKTNRQPPADIASVPVAYLSQMAAYGQALARIYPNHRLQTALIWTEGPVIMRLPDWLLAQHSP